MLEEFFFPLKSLIIVWSFRWDQTIGALNIFKFHLIFYVRFAKRFTKHPSAVASRFQLKIEWASKSASCVSIKLKLGNETVRGIGEILLNTYNGDILTFFARLAQYNTKVRRTRTCIHTLAEASYKSHVDHKKERQRQLLTKKRKKRISINYEQRKIQKL